LQTSKEADAGTMTGPSTKSTIPLSCCLPQNLPRRISPLPSAPPGRRPWRRSGPPLSPRLSCRPVLWLLPYISSPGRRSATCWLVRCVGTG
jgi:hypothetical protein